MEVIIPMGSSEGATTFFATISERTRKTPPNKNEQINKEELFGPKNNLKI